MRMGEKIDGIRTILRELDRIVNPKRVSDVLYAHMNRPGTRKAYLTPLTIRLLERFHRERIDGRNIIDKMDDVFAEIPGALVGAYPVGFGRIRPQDTGKYHPYSEGSYFVVRSSKKDVVNEVYILREDGVYEVYRSRQLADGTNEEYPMQEMSIEDVRSIILKTYSY